MNKRNVIIFNILLIALFYIFRVTFMNWIFLFDFFLILEIIIILTLMLRLLFRKYRIRNNIKRAVVHVSLIISMILLVGDFISIGYLNIYHKNTIKIFEKFDTIIPVADRVSGSWIIEDKSFKEILSEEEYITLRNNFKKSSPCQYEDGYCYVEFGGFLKNVGGYYCDLRKREEKPLGFGFTRINKRRKLINYWGIYNR